uniref:Uncharacterized protein n=1 Tax=Anguilla anguilla TaxID=7936 RepID=A0A0E9T276_ANGAN
MHMHTHRLHACTHPPMPHEHTHTHKYVIRMSGEHSTADVTITAGD